MSDIFFVLVKKYKKNVIQDFRLLISTENNFQLYEPLNFIKFQKNSQIFGQLNLKTNPIANNVICRFNFFSIVVKYLFKVQI